MRVLVLYPQYFTSPIVNILTPLNGLVAAGQIQLDHCREDAVTPEQVRQADVLIACRSVDPNFKPIYDYALALGIPIIYDIDDNLFAVPKESEAYHYFGHPDKQAQLRWLVGKAALVRAYSPALVDVLRPLNPRVQFVWSAVDWNLVPASLPPLRQPLEIVYAVSPYSAAMFYPMIRDDLKRLLTEFGERVHFSMLGYAEAELAQLPNVSYQPFRDNYSEFFTDFTRHGYAIGLAPMKQDLFYECKTDLKFRDYAAAGAVGVYSQSPLYQQVENGVTGLLVENRAGAWYEALADLIQQPEKIGQMRQAARQFAFEHYHVKYTSTQWWHDLQTVEKTSPKPNLKHPETWWFTRSAETVPKQKSALLKVYQRYVPYGLHIRLSRIYHQARKILAAIPH